MHMTHVTKDAGDRAAEYSARLPLVRNTQNHRPSNIERDVDRISPAPGVNGIGDNRTRTRR
jgi:hypothetical protein